MLTRFPDKPLASSVAVLPSLRDGQWLAEFKYDGWRVWIEVGAADDGSDWRYTTRRDKPCPVSRPLRQDVARQLAAGPANVLPPPGTIFDAEWMARRAGHARGEERVWLFDLLRVGPAGWRLGSGALERFDALRATAPAGLIVPHTLAGYGAFFESSKLDPCTEGVVLKRVDSRYIGSARGCCQNPAWLKVKWRDGAGGNKRIA